MVTVFFGKQDGRRAVWKLDPKDGDAAEFYEGVDRYDAVLVSHCRLSPEGVERGARDTR